MSHKALPTFVACLLVAGFQAPPAAAADPNLDAQMQNLYRKLRVILMADQKDAIQKEGMLILANPGLPLPDAFDTSNPADQQTLDDLADTIPMVAQTFQPRGGRVSTVYSTIVNNKQLINAPVLSPAQRRELMDNQAIVDAAGARMAAYQEYRQKVKRASSDKMAADIGVMGAKSDLADARKTGASAQIKAANAALMDAVAIQSSAKEDLVDANLQWEANGHKTEIEGATNKIRQLNAASGNAWWESLAKRITASSRNGDDTLQASYYPSPEAWHRDYSGANAKNNPWTHVTYHYGDSVDQSLLNSEGWHAEVEGSVSWFSLSAAVSKLDMTLNALMTNKDLSLEFEVMRVNIFRKWYDPDIFANANWTLPPGVAGGRISWGDLLENKLQPCSLPLVPTAIFLAKDLKVHTTMSQASINDFSHKMDLEVHMELGPFTLSGGYHKDNTGRDHKYKVDATGIECPGVQIIGYLATVPQAAPLSQGR